ncbi:Leucine-rich repeat-containing protein [Schistosoma japonicum]|uniref:Leucine-rich repeat-containing protein n=1 Tax=Schistosoma japonicum TaxID=6182 RepID=A0A4Z2D858_SCHJA|nr:Leucine-rich repeat-containing protein [Schistosoma japonicum]
MNNPSEIHQKESSTNNPLSFNWFEDKNHFLTNEDIRTMFLEGYENIEGLSIQETSSAQFASSWMDTKLDKTRARSRLWPRSKCTTMESNSTDNDSNSSTNIDLKLDEYYETDLDNENFNFQETDHIQLVDLKNNKVSSKRERINNQSQKDTKINFNNEEESNINSKIFKSYKENSYLTAAYPKTIPLMDQLKHDTVGISHYLYFCAMNHVSPLRSVIQNLGKKKLLLQHRGLGKLEIRLITEALRHNTTVTWLDLSYNILELESLTILSKVISENTFIQTLILSECKLRKDGLMELYNALIKNVNIKSLDLSGCDLGDSSCSMLAEILIMNRVLKYFNLARNQISSDGGELLGDAISSNDTLIEINLSWNSISNKGALEILKGIKENIRLGICNLSWNGISGRSALEIAHIIKENTTIEELYLQYNRISDNEIETIGQAISIANDSNPISTKGLYNFFKQLNKSQCMKLQNLIMEEIPVNFECMQLIESFKKSFINLSIIHGPQLIVGNTQDDVYSEGGTFVDLLFLLQSKIKYNGKVFIDVLQNFDVNKTGAVNILQFTEALKIVGVNYKFEQINDLLQRFDKYGDGTIYYK